MLAKQHYIGRYQGNGNEWVAHTKHMKWKNCKWLTWNSRKRNYKEYWSNKLSTEHWPTRTKHVMVTNPFSPHLTVFWQPN
jgi:hypothetical protein